MLATDLLKGNVSKGRLGSLVASVKRIGDIVKGGAIPQPTSSMLKGLFEGSMEKHISDLRPHLIAGSGCEHAPPIDKETGQNVDTYSTGEDGKRKYHYHDVLATHPDHGIVQCSDENRFWKVPFTKDADSVTTGDPEELAQVFEPVGDAPSADETTSANGQDPPAT